MEYKETDKRGSFDACVSGFKYIYDSDKKSLHILTSRSKDPLLEIPFDHNTIKDSHGYIKDIDKANQIYAMMMSNNATINLVEILEGGRLSSILQSSLRVARYSHYLETEDFSKFSKRFCRHFSLKDIKIKRISGRVKQQDVYVGKMKTRGNASTKAVSETLHGTIKDLSEQTVRDLITSEHWSVRQHDAHNLLSISTNLATISYILDESFSPHKRIAKYANTETPRTKKETRK